MSDREMRRAAALAQVKSEAWTLVEAAERMELSYRQAKRLWKRYRSKGAAGLLHGSAGRKLTWQEIEERPESRSQPPRSGTNRTREPSCRRPIIRGENGIKI